MDVTSYLLGKNAGGGSQPVLQSKEIEITENGTTNVTADSGYDGLSEVEVTTNVSGSEIDDYIVAVPARYSSGIAGLIKKLPELNFQNITNFSFSGCSYLERIEGITNTSGLTSMSSMFNDCVRLQEIPLFDTSNVTNMSYAFKDTISITTIPLFNTSKVTNMSNMFYAGYAEGQYGGSLTNIPVFNTSKVTNMSDMFHGRNYLSDTSLDNILQMCINATSYTGTKTLVKLGITSTSFYPASRIESLPHYQDFVNAGWTIGY